MRLLQEAIPDLLHPPHAHVAQHLTRRGPVLERARRIMDTAQQTLHLAMWTDEADELAEEIRSAKRRRVSVFLLAFGEQPASELEAVPHRLVTANGAGTIGRRLLLVVGDGREALIGSVVDDRMSALYSDDPAVTLVVLEYIRHDIGLQTIAGQIGVDRVAEIWRRDAMLRGLAEGGLPGAGPSMEELE
jgi:hypothetical protein